MNTRTTTAKVLAENSAKRNGFNPIPAGGGRGSI